MQSLDRLKSTRKRKEYDFYETPYELCRQALFDFRRDEKPDYLYNALDVGAGNGVWGKAFTRTFNDGEGLFGIEIQNKPKPENYDVWWCPTDYLELTMMDDFFGLVFGNPPYSLAEEFVRHSFKFLLSDEGYIFLLLRLAFLESKKRHFGLFTDHPPKRVYVLSRRPSFFTTKEGRKTTDALSYAMFLFQDGWYGKTELEWMYWNYDE